LDECVVDRAAELAARQPPLGDDAEALGGIGLDVAARDFAALLDEVEPADDAVVPATSVLREFIGGSAFETS